MGGQILSGQEGIGQEPGGQEFSYQECSDQNLSDQALSGKDLSGQELSYKDIKKKNSKKYRIGSKLLRYGWPGSYWTEPQWPGAMCHEMGWPLASKLAPGTMMPRGGLELGGQVLDAEYLNVKDGEACIFTKHSLISQPLLKEH